MSVGSRIKFIRNMRGLTQKELGAKIGFSEKAADVRVAQYESDKRTPREDIMGKIAHELDVIPFALDIPDIETYYGMIHTLFAFEDIYGLKVDKVDGTICLTADNDNRNFTAVLEMLNKWHQEKEKLARGEISKEEYDQWRYNYPDSESERLKAAMDEFRNK